MKKILSLLLFLAITCSSLLSLVSCKSFFDDEFNEEKNEEKNEDKSYLDYILSVDDEKYKTIESRYNDYKSSWDNIEFVSLNSADNKYTIKVAQKIGSICYINNSTGQMVYTVDTSCKGDYPHLGDIKIDYTIDSNSSDLVYYGDLFGESLIRDVFVEQKENSIVVNYSIENEKVKFFLPTKITAEKLERELLVPMLNDFRDLMIKHCNDGKYDEKFDIFKAERYNPKKASLTSSVYYKGALNIFGVQKYAEDMREIICTKYNVTNANLGTAAYKELDDMFWDMMDIYVSGTNGYKVRNLNLYPEDSDNYGTILEKYYSIEGSEISKTLEPIYEFTGDNLRAQLNATRLFAKYMSKYRAASGQLEYTKEEMLLDEAYCGVYFDKNVNNNQTLKFECSIEYSFDVEGNLCVAFIDKTKEADKAKYVVTNISILENLSGEYTLNKPKFSTDGGITVVTMKNEETE